MTKEKQKRRIDSLNSKQSRSKINIGFGRESRSQLRTDLSKQNINGSGAWRNNSPLPSIKSNNRNNHQDSIMSLVPGN